MIELVAIPSGTFSGPFSDSILPVFPFPNYRFRFRKPLGNFSFYFSLRLRFLQKQFLRQKEFFLFFFWKEILINNVFYYSSLAFGSHKKKQKCDARSSDQSERANHSEQKCVGGPLPFHSRSKIHKYTITPKTREIHQFGPSNFPI